MCAQVCGAPSAQGIDPPYWMSILTQFRHRTKFYGGKSLEFFHAWQPTACSPSCMQVKVCFFGVVMLSGSTVHTCALARRPCAACRFPSGAFTRFPTNPPCRMGRASFGPLVFAPSGLRRSALVLRPVGLVPAGLSRRPCFCFSVFAKTWQDIFYVFAKNSYKKSPPVWRAGGRHADQVVAQDDAESDYSVLLSWAVGHFATV